MTDGYYYLVTDKAKPSRRTFYDLVAGAAQAKQPFEVKILCETDALVTLIFFRYRF